MRLSVRFVVACLAEEQVHGEAERIGDGEDRGDSCQHRDQPIDAEQGDIQRLVQHHLFGNEAAKRRDARHRARRQCADHGCDRHDLGQCTQLADVARAAFMVDDSGRHEQRRLERRVIEDVQNRRDGRRLEREAEQHHQQAKLADRRIGEDRLQIMPEDRHPCAEHHGRQSDECYDDGIKLGAGEHRPQARQQENTRLHHGRGMEIGTHRRRCRHRVRQPEVERELRRFREAADQDEDQDGWIVRRCLHHFPALQDGQQVEGTGHDPQQQHACDQDEASAAGNRQCHARALPCVRAVPPEADQQEG